MALIACLVDAMALLALLLAFRALVGQMAHHILSWDFNELASVTRNEFHRTDVQVSIEVTSTHGWVRTFVWAG